MGRIETAVLWGLRHGIGPRPHTSIGHSPLSLKPTAYSPGAAIIAAILPQTGTHMAPLITGHWVSGTRTLPMFTPVVPSLGETPLGPTDGTSVCWMYTTDDQVPPLDTTTCKYRTQQYAGTSIDSSRPGQNGRHFADDIFKRIFLNENVGSPMKKFT